MSGDLIVGHDSKETCTAQEEGIMGDSQGIEMVI